MRYPAAEKLEIIRLVEGSHLPVRRTLARIGVPATTFYRWYDRYREIGPKSLEDRSPRPGRVWNRIPDPVRERLLALALEAPELSSRELAVRFTDQEKYFVSEASVYRLLKAHDLITSPAFIVVKAAEAFTEMTTAPNQLWQTDFTYLKVIGWGWFYLSTILDDHSRFIVAWKLCTTMRAGDVTDTLDLALEASGCDAALCSSPAPAAQRQWFVLRRRRPRALAQEQGIAHIRGAPNHRALAPDPEEPGPARELLPPGPARGRGHRLRRPLQPPPPPREPRQPDPCQRLLRPRPGHPRGKGEDQQTHHPKPPLEPSRPSGIT
jgi:transposase InsO family protein